MLRTFTPLNSNVKWQGSMLNWPSIIKFSLILLIAQTAIGTLTALLVGVENLVKQSANEMFAYHYLPSVLVGLVVLIFYAKQQSTKTLLHLTIAVTMSTLLDLVGVSALMGSLYFSPTWVIDLPIAVITILVATLIGSYFRGSNKHDT